MNASVKATWILVAAIACGCSCAEPDDGQNEKACEAAKQRVAEFVANNNACETRADCYGADNQCYQGPEVDTCGAIGLNRDAGPAWASLRQELGFDYNYEGSTVCTYTDGEPWGCGSSDCGSDVTCQAGRCITCPVVGCGTNSPEPDDPGQCYAEVSGALDPAETSPLGFSGEEVLGSILGEFATELTFVDVPFLATWVRGATYAPVLTLSWTGGEVRFISDGAGPECDGRVEVDVELSLVTADGSFDEVHPVVLEAREPTTATFFLDLFPPDLSGTFDAAGMVGPSTEVNALSLIGTVTDRSAAGSLMLAGWSSEVGSFGQDVAHWSSVTP